VIVEPYKRPPAPPRVAVLTEAGAILAEDGRWLDVEEGVASGYRVFAQWDVVKLMMYGGVGEALCWNNEEVRWRFLTHPEEEDWRARPSDVFVLRLPLSELLPPRAFLAGVVAWRDWLARWGASPTGTTGSSSMALLRARLERRVACGTGERPPFVQTRGGRMQLGPAGPGRYEGRLLQLDLPAAYARRIGATPYGGIWQAVEHSGRRFDYWLTSDTTRPLFVRAEVRIPKGLPYGPLIRYQQRRISLLESQVQAKAVEADGTPWLYPVGRRISGVWTRGEIVAAIEAGCKVRMRAAWVHRSPWTPFAAWWEAVEDGRERLSGAGEALAKMTGNALWGRFCLDPRVAGRRTIRGAGLAPERARLLKPHPAPPPAHDLAEWVSGSTRGELYRLMVWAGERLLSVNTDGAWVADDGSQPPEGWRVKTRAHRLDLIAPSCLRYWPERSRWPRTVFAGVPAIEAKEAFEREWQLLEEAT
jgi:hypothetical protein